MGAIGEAVADQFARAWEMFAAFTQSFPEESWRAADRPELCPARWAYHAVSAADFYSRQSPDGFRQHQRFRTNWETDDLPKLPSQGEILSYAEQVRNRQDAWLRSTSDAELLAANDAFPWTGKTVLDRMVYSLRHLQHHTGEMRMLQRVHGLASLDWR